MPEPPRPEPSRGTPSAKPREPAADVANRRLLAALRDIMAGSGDAASRLDRIVAAIAREMVVEVCSCYLARPGEVLELFATVGLNKSAVQRTRLRVGEGLVGEVAQSRRPLAIEDAPAHPKFAYRPETGEDPYHSFLGTPILRGGRVRGVLVIQSRRHRRYRDDEVETVQTIAMVVAELLVARELGGREEIGGTFFAEILPTRLAGIRVNGGLALGQAVLHQPSLTVRQMVADDAGREVDRLKTALVSLRSSLDTLFDAAFDRLGSSDGRDVLEAYRMVADDAGWMRRLTEAIGTGLTAEAAVLRVRQHMEARLSRAVDPVLREKLMDFDDLSNRLLLILSGRTSIADTTTLPDDIVLFARSIGPAELLDYDQQRLRGLVLEDGSATAHVAVVARSLGIPVVGRCADVLGQAEPLDTAIIDGDNGQVFLRPGDRVLTAFRENAALRRSREEQSRRGAGLPSTTRDGVSIRLLLNCGLLIDVPHLASTGAAGIGLYRTEIPFMTRSAFPDVAAQAELYRRILRQAEGKPVTFRTLDVGGDKPLPYLDTGQQENPALGWRAIRVCLDRPVLLRRQLRALIHAADGAPIDIMFPMIADMAEFRAARALFERERERAAAAGIAVSPNIRVGAMVEVPSLLWQLDSIAREADFLSVGSNDLVQYLFASDRSDPVLGRRYDPLSVAFLRVLSQLAGQCRQAGTDLSICGDMAGRPVDALALIGLGISDLSMAPAQIGAVKRMIRSATAADAAAYMAWLLDRKSGHIRAHLSAFAQDHGIEIGA